MSKMTLNRSAGELLKLFGPGCVLTIAGFWFAYQFVDPAPPSHLTLGTGGVQGAYYQFGQRYQDLLARDHIELSVQSTAGSKENIALLQAGKLDVAFVQSGTGDPTVLDTFVSLGSLYFEPLWLFYHRGVKIQRLTDLHGKRVAIGQDGSGTQAIALQLLAANAVSQIGVNQVTPSAELAAQALQDRTLDAMFVVAAPQSDIVSQLLKTDGIEVLHFERAEAYTRRYHFLSHVTLPEGSIDLAANIPAHDLTLIAPVATLVATTDLHPALVSLLLQAAEKVHGKGDLFERPGQFPSPQYVDFPLNSQAERFFKFGPPFLQRYLPFWAATLVDRLLVMMVPLIALLLPFMRLLPPMYRWRIRSRIYRWYRELLVINPALDVFTSPQEYREHLGQLDRIEEEVSKLTVPLSYADQLYNLRVHIELVREKLRKKQDNGEVP